MAHPAMIPIYPDLSRRIPAKSLRSMTGLIE